MKLTAEEVRRIATLARLRLSKAEIEQYRSQLSDILNFVDQLSEVSTDGVPITAQVTGQTNVLADDLVANQPRAKALLAGSPATAGTSIKVPAVFDRAAS